MTAAEVHEWLAATFGLAAVDGGKIIEIPGIDRVNLAGLFADFGYRVGVEVGTERGLYAETLCQEIPQLHLTCVDPWKAYPGYVEHKTQSKLDGFHAEAAERLARFDVELVREFSVDAAPRFKNRSLDFVYVDGNHELSHVVNDLTAWAPKIRAGGVVAGHDYIRRRDPAYRMHVVAAVHAYTEAWAIRPVYVLGRKHPDDGEVRDCPRSWFWVAE